VDINRENWIKIDEGWQKESKADIKWESRKEIDASGQKEINANIKGLILIMQHSVVKLPKWLYESEDNQANLCPNAVFYSWFGQAKDIILQYFVHLSMFLFTFFWHCVHIFKYMSIFLNTCPHLEIYIQISEYMSTFRSVCRCFQVNVHKFWKYVHLMKYMPFLFYYYPMFILWY